MILPFSLKEPVFTPMSNCQSRQVFPAKPDRHLFYMRLKHDIDLHVNVPEVKEPLVGQSSVMWFACFSQPGYTIYKYSFNLQLAE